MAVDDLIGPAYEGLCKGAIGFDPTPGLLPRRRRRVRKKMKMRKKKIMSQS
jgi:hypothetical protein